VLEEDWWAVGNKDFEQFPVTISLTERPIPQPSQKSAAPSSADSSVDFEKDFMDNGNLGSSEPPGHTTPGFKYEYTSTTKIEDDKDKLAGFNYEDASKSVLIIVFTLMIGWCRSRNQLRQ
jgi:hypothetical protein